MRALRVVLAIALIAATLRAAPRFVAARLTAAETVETLEAALRWDPHNPRTLVELTLLDADLEAGRPSARAVELLERAVQLAPFDWRYAAELSWAYELAGRGDDAEAWIRRAIELDPLDAAHTLQYAGLLLGGPRNDEGLRLLRDALQRDAELLEDTAEMLLDLDRPVGEIAAVWPSDAAARLDLVQQLARSDALARDDVRQLASREWRELMSAEPPPAPAEADVLLRALLDLDDLRGARALWLHWLGRTGTARAFVAGHNWVAQGELDVQPTPSSLGWSLGRGPASRWTAEDSSEGGALRIDFDSEDSLAWNGPRQRFVLPAGQGATLTARVRTEGLPASNGVALEVVDAQSGEYLGFGPEVERSMPWRTDSVELPPTDADRLIDVRLGRHPGRDRARALTGTLWLDGVSAKAGP